MNTSVAQLSYEEEEEAVKETSELVERSLAELKDCLSGIHEKTAYLQACLCAPALIETESNPLWFLRVERFDANAAAQRLVNYWKERVMAFGKRAFLPVTDLSGKGALSSEDVKIHKTQLWANLPNDSAGRPVLTLDLSRLCSTQPPMTVTQVSRRLHFYWAARLSSNPKFHTSGVVDLRVVRATGFMGDNVRRNIALVSQALPFKFHRIHLCCVPPPESRKLFTKTVMPVIVHAFEELLPGRAVVHVGTSKEDMMERMSRLGLLREGVPTHLGGSWTYPADPDDDSDGALKKPAEDDLVRDEERLVARHGKRLKVDVAQVPSSVSTTPVSGHAHLMIQALLEMKRKKIGSLRQLLRTPVIQQRALGLLTQAQATVAGADKARCALQDTAAALGMKPPPACALTTSAALEAELRRNAAKKRLLVALRDKVGDRKSLQTPAKFAGLLTPNRSRRRELGARVAEILQNHATKKRT